MYNETIEKLIYHALADGEITAKEREVLLRKAETEGIDLDEFEMVLDARLFEKQKGSIPKKAQDNLIKCPACNEIIPTLSSVCPSCGHNDKSLEDLIENIEHSLLNIKSHKNKPFYSKFIENYHISLTILSLVFYVLFFKFTSDLIPAIPLFVTIILIVFIVFLIKTKLKQNINRIPQISFTKLFNNERANFNKLTRTIETFYKEGNNKLNPKVNLLLTELKGEVNIIEKELKKEKTQEVITYVILISIVLLVFMIPAKLSKNEVEKELIKHDTGILIEFENDINQSKITEAELISEQLKSKKGILISKSKLQYFDLSKKITEIEILINNRFFKKAQSELMNVRWIKCGDSNRYLELGYELFELEKVEKDLFDSYISKKIILNNQLPEKFKVEIENWY